jgi:poly-gamma-glutamate capsule biosynthesis protein CapA/YwtB (metallophosphatase superfamily)
MKLALAGDIALHGLISSDTALNGERFRWLEGELSGCDGLIANLEAPVEAEERNSGKKAHLFTDASVTEELLRRLNVVCVSLANNHILDCGREGLANTLALLDRLGIYHSGAGLTPEEAAPVIFPLAGKHIAFTAWNHDSTNPAAGQYPDLCLSVFERGKAEAEIRDLRRKADIVIASIHWGTDYSFFHERWQTEVVSGLAEAGADIIMGHHSHTLQPFETIGSSVVFYGLGSLVFGDFIRHGRMYALFRRTKYSAVFMIDENCTISGAIPTHELKGNRIAEGRKDIFKRNDRLLRMSRIRERSRAAAAVIRFHERVLSRVWEYFFGYYMNPMKRLFQVGNIRKASRLFR